MSRDESRDESLREVAAQLRTVPRVLAEAASIVLPSVPSSAPSSVVATGIGGSEGPARLFAARLASAGCAARFVPLSAFVTGRPTGDLLVVFSQGLSPNARLALRDHGAFARTWLVTAVQPERTSGDLRDVVRDLAPRVELVVHGPEIERGMLARFVGPSVASLVALRLASVLGAPSFEGERVADVYASIVATEHAPVPEGPLALVTAGVLVDALFGLRWRWLETFGQDPHVWDVLASAHGPLQALYERGATWFCFESSATKELSERLCAALPEHHAVRRLPVSSDAPLAFFEATAHLDAAILATLSARPRDLRSWPGKGADAPLYELGR